MQVYKETGETPKVIFHGLPLKDYPGGLAVDPSVLGENTKVFKKGTLLEVDWANKRAYIVKTAELQSAYDDSTDDHMKVYKNHEFRVDDYVTDGTNYAQITGIDTSNADYDKLNFGGTAQFGADLSSGDIVEQADGGSTTYLRTPNAVATTEVYVENLSTSNVFTGAAINAKVYEANLPYPITTSSSGGSGSDQKGTLEPQITFL